MKLVESWHSDRIDQSVTVVRWGAVGVPVLVFPTAGGDAEEIDRYGLVASLGGLLQAGRIKVYSIDSIPGRSLLERKDARHTTWLLDAFSSVLRNEIVPAIRADCRDASIELVTAGASIGAFNAVSALCRHPDVFRLAIGMSGTYDLTTQLGNHFDDHFYFSSPLHYLRGLEGAQLDAVRRRFIVLATGSGEWEDPGQTWSMAHVLGSKSIPNRVDVWSEAHHHDWDTWREMLPLYLDDMT